MFTELRRFINLTIAVIIHWHPFLLLWYRAKETHQPDNDSHYLLTPSLTYCCVTELRRLISLLRPTRRRISVCGRLLVSLTMWMAAPLTPTEKPKRRLPRLPPWQPRNMRTFLIVKEKNVFVIFSVRPSSQQYCPGFGKDLNLLCECVRISSRAWQTADLMSVCYSIRAANHYALGIICHT